MEVSSHCQPRFVSGSWYQLSPSGIVPLFVWVDESSSSRKEEVTAKKVLTYRNYISRKSISFRLSRELNSKRKFCSVSSSPAFQLPSVETIVQTIFLTISSSNLFIPSLSSKYLLSQIHSLSLSLSPLSLSLKSTLFHWLFERVRKLGLVTATVSPNQEKWLLIGDQSTSLRAKKRNKIPIERKKDKKKRKEKERKEKEEIWTVLKTWIRTKYFKIKTDLLLTHPGEERRNFYPLTRIHTHSFVSNSFSLIQTSLSLSHSDFSLSLSIFLHPDPFSFHTLSSICVYCEQKLNPSSYSIAKEKGNRGKRQSLKVNTTDCLKSKKRNQSQ